MSTLHFRPRTTFSSDLKRLGRIDATIIDEVRDVIDMLLEGNPLPPEFHDHELTRYLAGYREFHLRDTPKGSQPSATNDIIVIYQVDQQDLVLLGIRIGSHKELFSGKYKS